MRIGVAQIGAARGSFESAAKVILTQAERAAAMGVELLVFPSAFLAETDLAHDGTERMVSDDDLVRWHSEHLAGLACDCLVPIKNKAALGWDYAILSLTEAGVEVLDASSELMAGGISIVFSFGDYSLARDDDSSSADLLILFDEHPFVTSAMAEDPLGDWGEDLGQLDHWICRVCSAGEKNGRVFPGLSLVREPGGALAAQAPSFEESIMVFDLETSIEDLAEGLVDSFWRAPAPFQSPADMALKAVGLGIREYIKKRELDGCIVLADGGLPSLLLTVIATDALGPTNVHMLMSARGRQSAAADCKAVASGLRIESTDLDLDPWLSRLDDVARDGADLALAASMAREQGRCLLVSQCKSQEIVRGKALVRANDCLAALGTLLLEDILLLAQWRATISPVLPRTTMAEWERLRLPGLPVDDRPIIYATHAIDSCIDMIEGGCPEQSRSWDERMHDALVPLVKAWQTDDSHVDRLEFGRVTEGEARSALNASPHDEPFWEDRVPCLPAPPDLGLPEGLVAGLGVVGEDGVTLSGIPDELAKELMDSLSYLHDIALSGGFAPDGLVPPFSKPHKSSPESAELPGDSGQQGWLGPFSLN